MKRSYIKVGHSTHFTFISLHVEDYGVRKRVRLMIGVAVQSSERSSQLLREFCAIKDLKPRAPQAQFYY